MACLAEDVGERNEDTDDEGRRVVANASSTPEADGGGDAHAEAVDEGEREKGRGEGATGSTRADALAEEVDDRVTGSDVDAEDEEAEAASAEHADEHDDAEAR